jgi:phosphatidylinositol-3-phosphatase
MSKLLLSYAAALLGWLAAAAAGAPNGSSNISRYDHIVIVVEENKDYDQIIGNPKAPYLNKLAMEGANFTRMFAEEHNRQGNYFWLFSGSNQGVGFHNLVPRSKFNTSNLGEQLIIKGLSFKGYAQSLPAMGSEAEVTPPGCRYPCLYGRKHVPWISFANVPNGTTIATSSNLRFEDFPADFGDLPAVAFVIPDMDHDMHNGEAADSVPAGDRWLQANLDGYYQWAKGHSSLLIVTFDETQDKSGAAGLTDPAHRSDPNRIATIFAGAGVKRGHAVNDRLTHVNILRTIEAIYGLPKSGAQQPLALRAGIGDDATAGDAFAAIK